MEHFIHDRIDELLVKYLADEATPPEEQEVLGWLQADEANRHYFEHFKLIWQEAEQPAPDADVNKAWQKFQQRKKSGGSVPVRRMGWLRIAASVLLVACTAAITYFFINNRNGALPEMLAVTTANEVKADTLPDGSVATLNKNSKLTYPARFKGTQRKVNLQGEAFFSVTANKAKPFVITVNDVEIKVLGTSFNVRSDEEGTEVIVETGVVQVMRGGQMVELKAGERTILQNAEAADTIAKLKSDDKLYNYYISHTFICDNTPLWKLAEKLSEAYSVQIVFDNQSVRSLPLTVTFDQESLDVILKIISQTLGVRIEREGDIVTIH